MYKEIKCLRCKKTLDFIKQEFVRLGRNTSASERESWKAGALYCDIYICPECGELHFFKAEDDRKNPDLEFIRCACCKKQYDKNYPHCPYCGRKKVTENEK